MTVRRTPGLAVAALVAVAGCHRPPAPDRAADAPATAASVEPVVAEAGASTPTERPSSEAPVAIGGTQLLVATGRIHDPDAPAVEEAMRAAYARMRADEDDAASPLRVRTPPLAPDLLVYEPTLPGTTAVVFLHGYGGRFALPCWQVAHAVATLGVTTACPSIGTEGDWWTDAGQRVVRATVDALRAAGAQRVILVGLSNGGIGASRLAARMKGTFAGLALVSGADPAAASPGVPVLVVQGRRDAMSSAAGARMYAKRTGGRYVELDAGHFALLLRADDAERAIRDFVASL